MRTARAFVSLTSRSSISAAALLSALSLCLHSGGAAAQEATGAAGAAATCLTFKRGLSLGARLPFTQAKLHPGQTLTIAALGSSSTSGFGGFGTAFPEVMQHELQRLHPSTRIEVINSGRIGESLGDNIARLNSDVLRYKPDLVVWQIGTNDVVWRGIADNAKEMLSDSVNRIKATNADVVLFDLQYSPLVLLNGRYVRMEKIIAQVAEEQGVGHFPRFTLMKRAIDGGTSGLVSWDGLHNSSEGYKCMGMALAQMIDDAAR